MTIQRKIIHIDCDCFYAAVEMRDNPELADKAIAVGGGGARGVVATCNYRAREFGVRSAMSGRYARRLCPELIFITPRMNVYRQVSHDIHQIFKKYTSLIEPLSLDEAYLDVTRSTLCKGSATWIAKAIRDEIRERIGITASAGIAPNKFLAKVCSDLNKPDGQRIVLPDQLDSFLLSLPVAKIPGVGKVTNNKMQAMRISNCSDLQQYSEQTLCYHFGKFGYKLYDYARGIDNRVVKTQRNRKSISVEQTYAEDLCSIELCCQKIATLLNILEQRCEGKISKGDMAGVFVKMKFNDFSQTTVEEKDVDLSEKTVEYLFKKAFLRAEKPVRLLGVGVRVSSQKTFAKNECQQLALFSY